MAEPLTSSSTWAGPVRSPTARRLNVAIRTLGCKVNRVESEQIASELLGAGVCVTAEKDAAVVIINTCAVTGEAEHKARKAARHAAGLPGAPVVIVTGCAATVSTERMRALGERIIVEVDKTRVAARVSELLGTEVTTATRALEETFHTRRMLKIEDGCDAYCAYCIIPYARGVPRSVPLDQIVSTAQELVAAGVPEIVLTGINAGRYEDSGAGLADVIAAVADTGVARLRLSSVEPLDLNGRLLDELSRYESVCAHLHVPLQSGSDSVLDAMGRGYTVGQFEDVIDAARAALPDLAVTTDVIVGFPGETDADAQATIDACERIGFAKLHVFRYSKRAGTRAAGMADQVDARVAEKRAAALRGAGETLRHGFIERSLGSTSDLLVERVVGGEATGTTGQYLKVHVDADGLELGQIVQVRLRSRTDDRVCAELA